MIYNYLKIALRSLIKKKVFSFINICGLALGMAACLSIFYYIQYQFGYNESFDDSESIYRAYFSRTMENGEGRVYQSIGTALKNILEEVPEIESSFRTVNIDYQNNSLIYDNQGVRQVIEQTGVKFADGDIQKVLNLELAAGSFTKMNEPLKMILTESVASKFFNPSEAIGKTMTLGGNIGNYDYEIIGVIKDLPTNTTFSLNVLLSFPTRELIEGKGVNDNWESWDAATFIKSNVDQTMLEGALKRNVTDLDVFTSDETNWNLKSWPIEDIKLTTIESDGSINKSAETLLYGLGMIGLFILTIAWINFINLSTARAMERAREVGVRKALGSYLNQIRLQFMIESFVTNCLAAALAMTIVQFALPSIFFIDNLMNISEENRLMFWSIFGGVLMLGSFLSGLYPAFVLSGFKPVVVLKGKMTSMKSGELLRKGLVIFQFAASSIMIIGTYIVYEQIDYLKNKELGVNIDNVLILDAPPNDVTSDNNNFRETVNAFKEEINQLNAVKFITASSDLPGQDTDWGTRLRRPSESEDNKKRINLLACDKDFTNAYDIELAAGRFYDQGDGTFDKGHFVINEEALELLGFESAEEAIGKQLIEGRMFPELTIIGVVKNFHQESLKSKIEPLALVYSSWSNYYSLSLNVDQSLPSDQQAEALKMSINEVEKIWDKFFPEFPFDYDFLDAKFNEQFKSDNEFSFIISLFATLSVIIACLGLLGLASYSVLQRTKEIGIRKVLGASVARIFTLLTIQYLWLIVIALFIASPIAYFGVSKWLSAYPYKIDLSIWMFLLPIITILMIALVTIGSQVVSATRKNPVDSLRYE